MNSLSELLKALFDLSPIFQVEHDLATMVAASLTPILLIVAIYIRVMETQVDAIVSGGKWSQALRDIVLWSFVCGSYFAIGNYVIEFANPIYAWFDGKASLEVVMNAFNELKTANAKKLDIGSGMTLALGGSLYILITAFLYYLTLLIVTFISVFLSIAHAIIFGLAFIWGLIAIPMSISNTLRILRGWAYLVGLVIAWPVVQGLLMAMFTGLFVHAAGLLQNQNANAVFIQGDLQLLFAILNLVLAAVLVAAPYIANALVTNSPSAAGAITPFVGAAIAAAVGTAEATKSGAGGVRSYLQGGKEFLQGGASKLTPSDSTPRAKNATPSSQLTSPSAAADNTETPTSASTDTATPEVQQAKQQRRGAIVNQLRKNPKTTV